jgi:DNA-binding MarR family transcriptional regulator
MPNNQFKRRELYFVITGVANMALARRLQKYFRERDLDLTVEQWSILVHLWKYDGVSQQELSTRTFRDKPSITRLVDNLEKLLLVERKPSDTDRRINRIYLTEKGKALRDPSMELANQTLNEGLEGIDSSDIEITKRVLEKVYENLQGKEV